MANTLSSSNCTTRKEFALETLKKYPFSKVAIVSNWCPECYKGSVSFEDIYNPRSLIPREDQATDTWNRLMGEGKVDPSQVLSVLTPATKDNQSHILTNMRVVNLNTPDQKCGKINCEPTCILCFSLLSGPITTTEIWPNIPVHAKCCAPCSFAGCRVLVPRIPVFHTTDELLQRCSKHTVEDTRARAAAWRSPVQFRPRPPLTSSRNESTATTTVTPQHKASGANSRKPPRPTRLQAMNKKNPVRGLASLHKMLENNPLELTMQSVPSHDEQPVKRIRISHDYTPRPRTRYDSPEPELQMQGLSISGDTQAPAPGPTSLLLTHFP